MKQHIASLIAILSLSAGAAMAAETAPVKKSPAEIEKRAAERFKKSDMNGDGTLSKEEFLVRSEKRFNEIDADHDGKITPKEMKTHRQAKRAEHEKRRAEREKQKDTATSAF